MPKNYKIDLWIAVFLATSPAVDYAREKESAVELDTVKVIGVTPIQGSGIAIDKIPSNVQTVSDEDLSRTQSLTMSDYMNRYLGSVHINEAQNNPFQPDVYFRGFNASPLLGLPQGLSVYVNGVRFNEPFGDNVNWDLIPEGAYYQMILQPGSNPLFGLNTLGGAISLDTKTGFTAPGHQFETFGGSWDRSSQELSSGWNNGEIGYFFDVRNFYEKGWRDRSPSRVKQVFSSFSWRGEDAEIDLNLAANDNRLLGNGPIPIELFRENSKTVFTFPDATITRMFLASLDGNIWLNDNVQLSGTMYFRQNRLRSFNGDDTDLKECALGVNAGLLCEEAGAGEKVVVDINGNNVVEDDSVKSAINNFSRTNQRSYGATLQSAFTSPLFGKENQLILGVSFDRGKIRFQSDVELAQLRSDRGTASSGILTEEGRVRLDASTQHYGIYFSDTFSPIEELAFTVAGRYNHSQIKLGDRFGDDLNGDHSFNRFNPSVGMTYNFLPGIVGYANYSEASRAPTPVELSCANPDDPCKHS